MNGEGYAVNAAMYLLNGIELQLNSKSLMNGPRERPLPAKDIRHLTGGEAIRTGEMGMSS